MVVKFQGVISSQISDTSIEQLQPGSCVQNRLGGKQGTAAAAGRNRSAQSGSTNDRNQEGAAAGLASVPAGLAIPPAGLASPAGLAASDGDASGDEAFCCLLQAIAAKNIDMRARTRTLRIPPPWDRAGQCAR